MKKLSEIWEEEGKPKAFILVINGAKYIVVDMKWLESSGLPKLHHENVSDIWGWGLFSNSIENDTSETTEVELRGLHFNGETEESAIRQTLENYQNFQRLKVEVLIP